MVRENLRPNYKYITSGKINKQDNDFNPGEDKKRRSSFVFKAIGVGFTVFLVGFIIILYVYQSVQIYRINDQINGAVKTVEELKQRNQILKLEIAQKKSLKEIEEKARKIYGMVEPDSNEVYYISLQDEKTAEIKNNSDSPKAIKNFIVFVDEVTNWFKNLTSVQAGTLDE